MNTPTITTFLCSKCGQEISTEQYCDQCEVCFGCCEHLLDILLKMLLEQDGKSTFALCRAVNQKATWCSCKEFQNPRKRAAGYPTEECCIKFSKVKRSLNKLIFEGKIVSFRGRVSDAGQPRGWDVMTLFYIWNSEHLPNPSQEGIHMIGQKVLDDYVS